MADVISGILMGCMGVLVVLMLLCLYRAVRGPRFTDRIVMCNAISTMVIVLIVVIAYIITLKLSQKGITYTL